MKTKLNELVAEGLARLEIIQAAPGMTFTDGAEGSGSVRGYDPTQPMDDEGDGKKPKLGTGKRFAEIEKKAKKSGAKDPAAVAAAAGIAKYGKVRMTKLAAAGRRRVAKGG